MFHSKQVEASVINNTSTRKVNSSETDYLTPTSPSNTYFSYSSKLSNYMGNQDVDMVQYTLECNQAMKEERLRPPQRTRREPAQEELKIQNPTWGVLDRDLKKAWIKESDINKEKIIAQFSGKSISAGPVANNCQLHTDGRTVYKLEFEGEDGEGYYSDCTATSEATYNFNVHSSVYDTTTADDDSNGESVLEGSELNVNAAAAKKTRPSILKGKSSRRKKLYKSNEMPAGAVPKMMASKQLEVRDPVTNELVSYITYAAKMATINYSRCDSLVSIETSC